ncbi:MAG: helix-turn-helix transcriptional regulator [Gammaproteobacteria bacterium]|nr:helix-turn-helix transcriptional regulator [Gammaproteobacteria bacterium]
MLNVLKYTLAGVLNDFFEDQLSNEKCRKSRLLASKISDSITLIRKEPEKSWTKHLLTKEIGLSRSFFSEKFREYVGQTVISYLTKYRLNLACEMIVSADYSILEIASKVGYESEISFARAFRRIYGISPYNFRKSAFQLHISDK